MLQLKHAIGNIKYDIIGLSDIRRMGNSIIEDEDHVFCYMGERPGRYGVGFLIKKDLKPNIDSFIGLSERVCLLKLKFEEYELSIIQVYAPTTEAPEQDLISFYDKLLEAQSYAGNNLIIMGDFNSKIGYAKPTENLIMGKFGFGQRNERGDRLIKFALENKVMLMNTFYKMKRNRKWTWISPDKKTRNEIDFILSNKPNQFENVEVLNNITYSSDHRLVRATITLKTKKKKRINFNKAPQTIKSEEEQKHYIKILQEKIKNLNNDDSVETYHDKIHQAITHSIKEAQSNIVNQKKEIISNETKELISNRHKLQNKKNLTKEEKNQLKLLYKTTNKSIKNDYKTHRMKIIENFLVTKGSTKKAGRLLNKEKTWIPKLSSSHNNNKVQSRSEIIKIATDYYRTLYSTPKTTPSETRQTSNLQTDLEIKLFDEAEIVGNVEKLKSDKSPGPDNLSNEMIKLSRYVLSSPLTHLFNKILREETVPKSWVLSDIILLYKKGDPADVGNYRPISLMPNLYKLFASSLEKRIKEDIDKHQPVEQAGFRKGFNTVDHIHAIEQIIEKYEEFNAPLYLGFVDYKKAFDSILHQSIWDSLSAIDIPQTYINIIKDIYSKSRSRVKLDRTGDAITIGRGVRQGDPLSPKLFINVLQHVMSNLDWYRKGILIDGKYFNHLRFADDIVLAAESADQLEKMLNDLHTVGSKVGLEMNTLKTKILTNRSKQEIKINNETVEYVEEYIYLGKQLSFNKNRNIEEIKRRINITWSKFWSYKEIMKSNLPVKLKAKVMNSCLLPCLTYACQTWIFNKTTKNKIQVCQRAMERSILNIKLRDKQRNSTIRKKTQVIDALQHAQALKWRWAGHLARSEDSRWTLRATAWLGPHGKRKRGRPVERWHDEIVELIGNSWLAKAKNRKQWKLLEEAYTRRGVLNAQ